jgi:plastocyanin
MRHRYALLAVLLPVIGACSNDSASETSSPVAATTATSLAAVESTTTVPAVVPETTATPADPTTTVAATGGEAAVAIADFTFTPSEIRVPVGGSVVWTNNDAQPHTATSAGVFDAGSIQPQTSVTVDFPVAGSFAYICSFHPFMTGTVVVA